LNDADAQLQELKQRLYEVNHLESSAALLTWDHRTYMPAGGGAYRAQQLGTLRRLAHEKFTDSAVGRLLDDLRPLEDSLPFDSDEASLIRVTRRDYEKALRIPAAFKAELDQHRILTYGLWTEARPANDFARMVPYLEKTLDLSRRYADFFPGYDHLADPLIDARDEGVTAATLRDLFDRLREALVPLARDIAAQPPVDDSCLFQSYPVDKQLEFGLMIAQRFGYDMRRGRQDRSAHPVSTAIARDDVRITTRVAERDLRQALFATLHETGHALYSQGIRPEIDGLPIGHGATAGVHESQSRLWENMVGRSTDFWEYFYPQLQAVFPSSLQNVSHETFCKAINKVEPSPIRVGSDEVTYNLHCAMRFQIELDLLDGRVAVRDLPEVWRERLLADLGIEPPDDRDGVLQDMNWYSDWIGGLYQHYTLGNIIGAQLYEVALRDHPDLPDQIRQGEFGALLGWLRANVHTHGRKFTIDELMQRVVGGPLDVEPFIGYIREKYE
jgi:carboxypeptidase Taq